MRTQPRRAMALFGSVVLLLSSSPAWAQMPTTVSFRAVSDAGQPVPDLKPTDLALKMDGKVREVKSLELVRIGAGGTAPTNPALASNTAVDTGRDVILVIDDESLAPGKEQSLRAALGQFLTKLTPVDRVGMLSLRNGGTSIAATTDRAKIAAAIDNLKGEAASNETVADFQCRTIQTLQSVKGLLEGAPDAKTTFVLASTGIAPLPPEQARMSLGTSSGVCQLRTPHFSDVGTAASRSPAAVYVLYLVDGRATPNSDAQAGLESLAGVASATMLRLAGNNPAVLDRVAQETAAYYLAVFDAQGTEYDGNPHTMDLRVSRNGVQVKAGNSLALPKPNAKASPKDMIRTAESYRALPLRATGWAMRDAGNKLKVIALFEPETPGAKLASAMVALIDGNTIKAQWTAQPAELERSPTMAALLVAPGTYRLRVAAVDASGRAGMVDYPLQAQMTAAGPFTMSALTVGVADNGFKPRIVFSPADQGALGYLELYGVPKGAAVTASIELAPTESAPAIATTPGTIQPSTTDDLLRAVGGFSIGALAPGDYVMRMIISVDGKAAGTAMRTIRKVAK